MTAPATRLAALFSTCARCDGPMAITRDAIGRERYRCPKCDGVARNIRVHPDDAQVPQGLVRAPSALPAIAPGQLRCQGCARGVPRNARFCADCAEEQHRGYARRRYARRTDGERASFTWKPKPCRTCGTEFQPTGPAARYCEACR